LVQQILLFKFAGRFFIKMTEIAIKVENLSKIYPLYDKHIDRLFEIFHPLRKKFHHEFKVTLAECPNACSQPQIRDIGIIGACMPLLTDETCTVCDACVDECKENAISIRSKNDMPEIDYDLCLDCGKCIEVCPTGTIAVNKKGFRVQLGGKLGRHPQLAKELPGIYNDDEVLGIVKDCIAFYKQNSKHGERFAEIFKFSDFKNFEKY